MRQLQNQNGTSMVLLLFFLLIIQFQLSSSAKAYSNVSCIDSERRALLKIKEGLIDDADRLSSWTGEECCAWEGVGCNHSTNHVVKLDLHNPVMLDTNSSTFDSTTGRLGGQIDPSILNLVQLDYLDLSLNDFSESPIPAFLGSLKNLRYLNLSGAGFSDEIPRHLGNLSNLQYLYIGDSPDEQSGGFFNSLSSKNLEWVSGLSSLKCLDLSGVDLSLAQDWLHSANMLPSLSSLTLRYTNIIFPLLPSVNNLTTLTSLDLGSNYFNSTFPLWLFNLTNLVNLQMDSNLFYGTIPDMFGRFTSLSMLNFSSNKFNSSIPTSFCTLHSLTRLYLGQNRIQGSLPLCLGNLTNLAELDLRENRVSGTIPREIGQLRKLTYLNLGSNHYLESSIPSSFGHLTKLKTLILSHNHLNGTFSPILEQLTELQDLDISRNSLTGLLSESTFAKLEGLEVLSISFNYFLSFNVSSQWMPPFQLREIYMDSIQIGPEFPPWLQTQKSVDVLSMQNCSISGTIPLWFETVYSGVTYLRLSTNNISGRIPEFKYANSTDRWIILPSNKFLGISRPFPSDITGLDLSNNSLSGSIDLLFPDNITNFSPIFLNLDDNHFTGNVPQHLCSMSSLQVVSLANNQLTGKIPQCLGSLQNLVVLNLANNNLSGHIPSTFQGLESLMFLHLNGNKLYGELPLSLQSLSLLVVLDLGENQLQGTIPEWIGKGLSSLEYLRLEQNKFYGDIPVHLCQLSLQVLNLAQNNLSGHIPPCFKNFRGMVSKDNNSNYNGYILYREVLLNFNKGQELEYSSSLKYLKSILLSGNKLVGEIPGELIELEGLQILNLSNNHLSGRIPENIGNLRQLESLDLAMNQLSGHIPQSLANIDALSYLNLSFNNLVGRIPSGDHFDTLNVNTSIYEGNNGLCGKPIGKSCPGDTLSKGNGHDSDQTVDDVGFEFKWFYAGIGPGFSVGMLGVFCMFYFNKSWRRAYFEFFEDNYNRVLTVIAVKISQIQRKFH